MIFSRLKAVCDADKESISHRFQNRAGLDRNYCNTTSLHHLLLAHLFILSSHDKGTHFPRRQYFSENRSQNPTNLLSDGKLIYPPSNMLICH